MFQEQTENRADAIESRIWKVSGFDPVHQHRRNFFTVATTQAGAADAIRALHPTVRVDSAVYFNRVVEL